MYKVRGLSRPIGLLRECAALTSFFCVAFMPAHLMFPQSSLSGVADIYKNFDGRWIGTREFTEDGVRRVEAVVIVMTEEKDGRSLRMEFTYGHKGDSSFSQLSKIVKLLPDKHLVENRYVHPNMGKSENEAVGLNEFKKTGLGSFVVYGRFETNMAGFGTNDTYRCETDLMPNEFLYSCAESRDAVHYRIYSIWKTKRDLTYGTSSGAPQKD
jgi:hypothetical protein